MTGRTFTDLNHEPTRVLARPTGEYDSTIDPDARAAVSRALEVSLGNCPYCAKRVAFGDQKEFDAQGRAYHLKCYGNPYPTTSSQNTQAVIRTVLPEPITPRLKPVRPFVPRRLDMSNYQIAGVTGR